MNADQLRAIQAPIKARFREDPAAAMFTVRAEGDIDSRGTPGLAKDAPVGFQCIRLTFQLDTDASADEVAPLIKLTERYCVIPQTLARSPEVSVASEIAAG